MKFENKGLDCKIARWRYDHFEASFLAFVREVDLEQIVHSDEEARKRSILESMISALQGEQTAIKSRWRKPTSF
jgi:hypothetical protein